ncbi:MAG TPA: hypothetical protein PKA14_14955 [Leptospiraceae bacterium]|nr:hypothetical protein [Leptospiraceae bacterium]
MTKEEFKKKHGEIRISERQNSYFERLKHPVFVNGVWKKRHSAEGKKILDGTFYNIGYFGSRVNPAETEHNWEALDYAIGFTESISDILKENECLALSSEGDAEFFPFIFTTLDSEGYPDDNAMQADQPKDVAEAYAKKVIRKSYSCVPTAYALQDNECVFWEDDFDEDIHEDLDSETKYNAYKKVSDIMKKELTGICSVHYYEDYVSFPAVIGGKDRFGNFIGLITSLVWT